MFKNQLVCGPIAGTQDTIPPILGYNWISKLPDKKIYFALMQGWDIADLPNGYDYYIVSFHLEVANLPWLKKQKVNGQIIVLVDSDRFNLTIPGVHFLPYFYWHYQIEKMQEWFGVRPTKNLIPQYKFSSVCNRITQSKLWITTKLLETAKESSLVVLNSWLVDKDVHSWQPTGHSKLDQLTQIFCEKYLGKEIKIDDFDNETQNEQQITATPWQPLYQDCALHFTNESFHYSSMIEDNRQYIWPGPFLTEKTFKCLLGGTAFVPVGQFETYKTLTDLGFNFEYDFDTSWDLDSGNLSRAASIIDLIDYLNQLSIDQLLSQTQESTRYNQNHITSGNFFKQCKDKNEESVTQIIKLIS
jgi:hypothetical protein